MDVKSVYQHRSLSITLVSGIADLMALWTLKGLSL